MERKIKIDNNDQEITILLESNTITPGVYINAEYDIPNSYRFNYLDNYIDKNDLNSIIVNRPTKYITNEKIVSTYEDVIEHFTESDEKYFVTGYTDSKFMLIDKYINNKINGNIITFDKINSSKTPFDLKKYDGTTFISPNNKNKNYRTNIKVELSGLGISAMILNEANQKEYVLYLDTKNPIKYIDINENLTMFIYMRDNNEDPVTANLLLYGGLVEEPKITSDVFINRGYNTAFEPIKKLKNIKTINELIKSGQGFYKINTKGYDFNNK